jgi:hypothetical protein
MEVDISEGSSLNPEPDRFSQIEVENETEARAFLHHSILMEKFKEFVKQRAFVDVQIRGANPKVNFFLAKNQFLLCYDL